MLVTAIIVAVVLGSVASGLVVVGSDPIGFSILVLESIGVDSLLESVASDPVDFSILVLESIGVDSLLESVASDPVGFSILVLESIGVDSLLLMLESVASDPLLLVGPSLLVLESVLLESLLLVFEHSLTIIKSTMIPLWSIFVYHFVLTVTWSLLPNLQLILLACYALLVSRYAM